MCNSNCFWNWLDLGSPWMTEWHNQATGNQTWNPPHPLIHSVISYLCMILQRINRWARFLHIGISEREHPKIPGRWASIPKSTMFSAQWTLRGMDIAMWGNAVSWNGHDGPDVFWVLEWETLVTVYQFDLVTRIRLYQWTCKTRTYLHSLHIAT